MKDDKELIERIADFTGTFIDVKGEKYITAYPDELKEIINMVRDNDRKSQLSIADTFILSVLATKHCPADHQDWQKIKDIVSKLDALNPARG